MTHHTAPRKRETPAMAPLGPRRYRTRMIPSQPDAARAVTRPSAGICDRHGSGIRLAVCQDRIVAGTVRV